MITGQIARDLLEKHGIVRPQPASDWAGPYPLPDSVERFYEEVGPVDVTIEQLGNPFFLPRLAGIWDMQLGYQWNPDGEPCKDWDPDLLVVAHECEGAFFLSLRSGRVLHDLHGGGVWRPVEIFADLNTMTACLATLGTLVAVAGMDFTNANSNIRPEYVRRAVSALRQFLPSASAAQFVLGKLGWVEKNGM